MFDPKFEIEKAAKAGVEAYQKIGGEGGCEHRSIERIQIKLFDKVNHVGPEESESWRFWKELDDLGKLKAEVIERPCIYAFQIPDTDEERNRQILDAYQSYKPKADRNASAFKKGHNLDTDFLYVGKVKFGVNGRMYQHLGYGNARTGALHLIYWAAEIDLRLNLHLFLFQKGLEDFLEPLEYQLAGKLNPLIGKHR